MKRERFVLLVGSCLVAVLAVATAGIAVPPVLRTALGMLTLFIVPGFALVCAVLPERRFSRGERLLGSVGMSLALATCAAVLLGALPVGLSRLSLAVALGSCTIAFSLCAVYRARGDQVRRRSTGAASNGVES